MNAWIIPIFPVSRSKQTTGGFSTQYKLPILLDTNQHLGARLSPIPSSTTGTPAHDARLDPWAIETAKRRGASYSDARVMDIRQRELGTKNGEVGTLVESETLGIGIRLIAAALGGLRPPTGSLVKVSRRALLKRSPSRKPPHSRNAQRRACAGRTSRRHLAESVPERSLSDSCRTPDRFADCRG